MVDITTHYSGKIVNAREAFDAGETRYFTGNPCKHGHIAQRMVANGVCQECLRARRQRNRDAIYSKVREWKLANPERVKLLNKQSSKRHPETQKKAKQKYRKKHIDRIRATDAERARRIRKANPEREIERQRRYRDKAEALKASKAGRPRPDICDLCKGNTGGIVFDHCHKGGQFRGWICDRCNKVLGLVGDSIPLLASMSDYLRRNTARSAV
jgi:hypothetical protein